MSGGELRIYHFTHELPKASGVVTFVRELSVARGVEGMSRIF